MRILVKDVRGCPQVINVESATYVSKGECIEIENGVLVCMSTCGLLIHSMARNWYLAAGLTFKECSKVMKHLCKKKQCCLYKDYDCMVYPLYDVARIQSSKDFLEEDDLDEDEEDEAEDSENFDESDERFIEAAKRLLKDIHNSID